MNIALRPGRPAPSEEFLNDVLSGLSRPRKAISPRWLYDRAGSEIFEKITELPEYYVTRVEVGLLGDVVAGFASLIGPQATVVEYGAGAAVKVRLLLDALDRPVEYVAIDISYEHLREAVESIAADYPDLEVRPMHGDFISGNVGVRLPHDGPRVGFFPGSTIGNLSNGEIAGFLDGARALLGPQGFMVLGADLRKDPGILVPAYDDAAGVTAAFNKNLLARINRELIGTINTDQFAHRAVWVDDHSRIEMHLESLTDQVFSVAGEQFSMGRGETIHTENSRKFTRDQLEALVEASGWSIARYATDADRYFAILLLKAV